MDKTTYQKADLTLLIGALHVAINALQAKVAGQPDGATFHGAVPTPEGAQPAADAPPTRILQGRLSLVRGLGTFYIPDYMREDYILRYLAAGREWEAETTAIYRALVRPGDFVMDVGAFNGSRTIRLSQLVGPEGCVYAFEPQNDIRTQLHLNLTLNNIQNVCVFPYAAANGYGSTQFYLNPTNRGASSIVQNSDTIGQPQTIHYLPIDAVVPDRPVTFMKIDVEGTELDLLLGARKTITKYHPGLFIEVFDDQTRRQRNIKTTRAEVFGLLAELGYEIPPMDVPEHDHVILPRRR